MTSRWDNPTGGFGYHLGALRRRDSLWKPFTHAIARWLAAWDPPERELLLLGPSGGWCLDEAFLGRFERVACVDIDPFAPLFFRWRARRLLRGGRTRFTWDARDHLSPGPDGFSHAPLGALLAEHPHAAVLWCNLLGQLPLFTDAPSPEALTDPPPGTFEHWLRGLPALFEGRSWASFHDRISGPLAPHALDEKAPAVWCSEEELVARHYGATDDPGVALFNHRTGVLCPDAPRWQFVWALEPGVFHLIEALSFRADARAG